MNRETPELDQDGLFVCRDCRLGTLFGLLNFLLSDAKLIHLLYICNNILGRYFCRCEESTEVRIWVHLWECVVCHRDKKQKKLV